jgi:orotidine 5'-phosphate decarboxylase subfamily 2
MEPQPFTERLTEATADIGGLLCVGIDPIIGKTHRDDLWQFCTSLVRQTMAYATCYKLNLGSFWQYGSYGLQVMEKLILEIAQLTHNRPVIIDCKVNDIGSSAGYYATGAFDAYQADGVTLNPLPGDDVVSVFAQRPQYGAFVLCHMSNPSAGRLMRFQGKNGRMLYQEIALMVAERNQHGNLGLVIGATYPNVLSEMRALYPATRFLIPGVGAQGGELRLALDAGLDAHGEGVLVNVSRGIIYADSPMQASADYYRQINQIRRELRGG